MKKFSIITLFLALLTMTVQAQENTYNMVIEMTNGTKITIGPNDIRSLTFNNGELTVTGESLQSWMESVPKRVDMLMTVVQEIEHQQSAYLATLKEYFGIDSYWDAGSEVSEALVNRLEDDKNRIAALEELCMQLVAKIGSLEMSFEDKIMDLKSMIQYQEERIKILEATLEAQ